MKTNTRSTKGFTLVEIMIVVVIIGLLAAMAIPAFKKVRENSIGKAMENDARQIGSAAQQYFLENPSATSVTFGANTATGMLTGDDLLPYVKQVSKGYTVTDGLIELADTGEFALQHAQFNGGTAVTFNNEGKKKVTP